MPISGWGIGVAEVGGEWQEKKSFTHLLVASTGHVSSTIIDHLLGFLCTSHDADLFRYITFFNLQNKPVE